MEFKEVNRTKMLIYYRYISLLTTSLFYILGIEQHVYSQRITVIVGMVFTALLMNYLYLQNKGKRREILLILIIETVGNCIILVPSGGLQSPYIWYILNTVIIAGIELGRAYAWGNAGIYLLNMIGVSYWMNLVEPMEIGSKMDNLNLVAGFLLMTEVIELLINYSKALEEKNRQSQHYLEYIMKIYETVYLFTSQEDKKNLIGVILDYLKENKELKSGLFMEVDKDYKEIIPYSYGLSQREIDALIQMVREKHLKAVGKLKKVELNGGYIGIPIVYTYDIFGILIIPDTVDQEEIKFITYVSGMIFKKLKLEKISSELLISEEQNRIANEIHDSVIQELFGTSCHLFTLTKKVGSLEEERLKKELIYIRGTITTVMAELRETIYGMSWTKKGKNGFLERLQNYIATMESLHPVKINLDIEGDSYLLTLDEQKAFYRICCEGVSNGIRHGKAKHIDMRFSIQKEGVTLKIKDNGKGFDYARVIAEDKLGLGIKNMEQLVYQLGGDIVIGGQERGGTLIDISVGNMKNKNTEYIYKEGII